MGCRCWNLYGIAFRQDWEEMCIRDRRSSEAAEEWAVANVAKTGYKAYKASKYTKKAVSTVKKAKTAKKVATKPKPTVSSKKTVKVTTKPKVVKMTTQTVKKQEKKVTSSAEVSKPKTTQNKTALLGAPGNKNPWKDGSKILSIEVTDDFYINTVSYTHLAESDGEQQEDRQGNH